METIYLIMVKTTFSDGTSSTIPIYADRTEENARKDCIRLQINHNKQNYKTFKEIYFYERINLYK